MDLHNTVVHFNILRWYVRREVIIMTYKVMYKVYNGVQHLIESDFFYVENDKDIVKEVDQLLRDYMIDEDINPDNFENCCILSTGTQYISVVVMVERVDLLSTNELQEIFDKSYS